MTRSAWIVLGVVISEAIVAHASIEQARAQEAPITNCDMYAAGDTDPQHKVKGVPYDQIDSTLAVPACEAAVRQYPNSSRLIFQLGRAYSKGNNLSLALAQFRKAASQGYPAAQYNLAVMYERAMAVKKDDAQALAWYRKAAEQGYANAQFNLGNMYAKGQGVLQNYVEAMKWFRLAAYQGDAGAQNNLGSMYAKGQGVPPDYDEAARWYRLSANQGNAMAQNNLDSLLKIVKSQSSSLPVPATNQAYLDGYKDSEAWGHWWRSLTGTAFEGAVRGSMSASPLPAYCADKNLAGCQVVHCVAPGETHDPLWIAACQEARQRLILKNKREVIDPEYKQGWDAEEAAFMEQYHQRIGETAFKDCVKDETRIGSYPSRDWAASVRRLIERCQAQAERWLNNCIAERDETQEDCDEQITLDAGSVIDGK